MPQSISAEPLVRMIRSITLQKRTGVLRVDQLGERSAERGEIYFENGSLVRARTEREAGKAALQRIGEWKQITCAFQNMNRPHFATARVAASAQEPERERSQAHLLPQTDHLARTSELAERERHGSFTGQPSVDRERSTHPLNPRQPEMFFSATSRPSTLPAETGTARQTLVLRGTKLEAYTPAPPTAPVPSVQYWTTHLASEIEPSAMPRGPSLTPRLLPLPDEEVPPGRMGIFKARSMVSTAQAIQQMERHARVVFILLDGRRTIQDIARLIHQTEYDVEQILVNLTQRGYAQYVRG